MSEPGFWAWAALPDDLARGLHLFSSSAQAVLVGKRGGCRSTPPAFIERLMLRLAKNGRVAARVKGAIRACPGVAASKS